MLLAIRQVLAALDIEFWPLDAWDMQGTPLQKAQLAVLRTWSAISRFFDAGGIEFPSRDAGYKKAVPFITVYHPDLVCSMWSWLLFPTFRLGTVSNGTCGKRLILTSTMPFVARFSQYDALLLTPTSDVSRLLQEVYKQRLFVVMSTMPSLACCLTYLLIFFPFVFEDQYRGAKEMITALC